MVGAFLSEARSAGYRLTRSVWSAAARDSRGIRISPMFETKLKVTKGNPDSPGGLADAALVYLSQDAGRSEIILIEKRHAEDLRQSTWLTV